MNLRERYEKETGKKSHQYGGLPNEDYVEWIEDKFSWIPTSKEQPEQDVTVLVFNKDGFIYKCFRDQDLYFDDDMYHFDAESITHWMPIPDPPAEEEGTS